MQKHYRVLARKYRPSTFKDLIGQEILVRILKNAIDSHKFPHALLLSGIRGVGKTTTARIIAKALNCSKHDASTSEPCGQCQNCLAISTSSHQDVLEMDAASNTGVNDIREIIDNTKYKPILARYKVYIIDEVHMLSNSAFNALLKTLEEPPQHVVFIFATTEVRKIPLTIISRCHKFQLQRFNSSNLIKYYTQVVEQEGAKAEKSAINIIAKAADGSVRDGLSILDQALSLCSGNITLEAIRDMVGYSTRDEAFTLIEHLSEGDILKALEKAQSLCNKGDEPRIIMQDLLELTHILTSICINKHKPQDTPDSYTALAAKLSPIFLSRLWQMLHKGLVELKESPLPQECLEMILIRVAYANINTSPEEILHKLSKGKTLVPSNKEIARDPKGADTEAPQTSDSSTMQPHTSQSTTLRQEAEPNSHIDRLLDIMYANDDMLMYHRLRTEISILNIKDNQVFIKILDNNSSNIINDLRLKLNEYTGQKWQVMHEKNTGNALSHAQLEEKTNQERISQIKQNTLVQDVLNTFTETKIADIKTN